MTPDIPMTQQANTPLYDVLIVGAGISGIGLGIRLREAGFDNFVILEKAADLGGTWRDNTYPGCACDVQSHMYSFSFEGNPDWSARYSGWKEIQDYIESMLDCYDDICGHLCFGPCLCQGTRRRF